MYTISEPSGVLRKDGVVVPQDDRTPEYQAYVAWLAQDNGPEVVADAQPERPRIDVSAWQIRKALNERGLRQAVEDAVAASADIKTKDGWNHSPRFYSDNQQAMEMAAVLNKTPAEMYTIFQLAETL